MKKFYDLLRRAILLPFHILMGVTTTPIPTGMVGGVPFLGGNKHFITQPVTVAIPLTGVTNDIVQAIPVKKGWLVKGTIVKFLTQGAATTITLHFGITGGDVDGFDAIDGKSAVGTVCQTIPADGYAVTGGFYVTADDTLDILLAAIDTMTVAPVVTVQAIVVDTNA
jgi:hypothetical protein